MFVVLDKVCDVGNWFWLGLEGFNGIGLLKIFC